mmetsp:Transcript_12250/g.10554  ORF Transcript_12250/g.10554 Transcript_12250/m.10554 type:complete len:209 (+) Transcript_12250:71-697(+)
MRTAIFIALAVFLISADAFLVIPSKARYQRYLKPIKIAKEVKNYDSLNAMEDFIGGILESFNIRARSDSIKCYDETSAALTLSYYSVLAITASTVEPQSIGSSVYEFIQGTGQKLISAIDSATQECIENSRDYSKITKRVGVEPNSQAFVDAFVAFFQGSPEIFSHHMGIIADDFANDRYSDAGLSFGHFNRVIGMKVNSNSGADGDL